ncbi:hypothetical protein [Streptomyces doebereineriae]|uniref:Uncharacterized protein n=1 Tax=Streptomyces doebereineriae TaxID=3075528 RepID=A0ABU2V3B5_9ACTN|nr:hypothetical protein [Streptomyces sp. DSM 41640]MDT0479755.1 hypothetical protein [Streptomyces sp. DSM 41640]
MKLHTVCPQAPRTWTVELRCQTGGIFLVCQHCPQDGQRVAAESARSAALAHLARHARGDLRAPYLRICQCHDRGCRWHRRHRGCAGPIRLLLACERGGRIWRLADVCGACAAATAQAAIVPDTLLAAPLRPPSARPRHTRRRRGPGDRVRVGEMLSYLAAALPTDVSARARLLALQCALRMNAYMHVELPAGLLRGLRIDAGETCYELERARWLNVVSGPGVGGVAAKLRDAALLTQSPARPDRRRAADWALRTGRPARRGQTEHRLWLLRVYLAAHSDPSSGDGLSECDRIIRDCGLHDQGFHSALTCLTATGTVQEWRICPDSGDVRWRLAPGPHGRRLTDRGCDAGEFA